MALNVSSVGSASKSYCKPYDWKTLATYALGIGAKKDELAYLYEGVRGGILAYPSFAVIAAFEPIVELMLRIGGDLGRVVHGGQTIRAHRMPPPEGTIETAGKIAGIYDHGKFAQAIIETRSTLKGEPLYETSWSLIFRSEGGFGGPPPPEEGDRVEVPEGVKPTWTMEQETSPEQALLYRLSGDVNPLHADPEIAASVGFSEGPILQGLSTFGFVVRAIVKRAAGGDAAKLRFFGCQFRKPVWPGDVIVTDGWDAGAGKVAIRAHAKGRPDPVLTHAWAEIGVLD
jgi:acyl dehydratase